MTVTCPNCKLECMSSDATCRRCRSVLLTSPAGGKSQQVEEEPLTAELFYNQNQRAKYTRTIEVPPSALLAGVPVLEDLLESAMGLVVGLIIFLLGAALCALIPIPGLLCGVPLMLAGAGTALSGRASGTVLRVRAGHCPYCGQINKRRRQELRTSFKCSACKRTIIFRDYRFYENYLGL
jgi:hypothetical protein